MNINFNKFFLTFLPYVIIILIAYGVSSLFFLYLPKSGIDFLDKKDLSWEYRKYNSFLEKESIKAKSIDFKGINNYILKAIYARKNSNGWIILENNSGKTFILSVSDVIDGYTLKEIYAKWVAFEKDSILYRLEFIKNNENKIEKIMENSFSIKKESINYYIKNPNKVWDSIFITENINNNKFDGFKIERITESSEFNELGLKIGDVIKKINNEIASYSSVLKMYEKINELKFIKIEILRDNKIMELNYEVN